MARKKKDLNINIDTKNVDIKVTRKDGKLHAEIDTKHVDVIVDKDEDSLDIDLKGDGALAKKLVDGLRNIGRVIQSKRK